MQLLSLQLLMDQNYEKFITFLEFEEIVGTYNYLFIGDGENQIQGSVGDTKHQKTFTKYHHYLGMQSILNRKLVLH